MRNKALDLSTYAFSQGEALLLDANVWLFLFPAPSDKLPGFTRGYSAALKRMLEAKVDLALDVLVLSEYLNSYCRIEWLALHKATYPRFKDFRQSPVFASVGQGAALFARGILRLCNRHDHLFRTANIDDIFASFACGVCDFNDGLLAEACRQYGWKLVTSDSDCTDGGIDVLTSNPKLLRACS